MNDTSSQPSADSQVNPSSEDLAMEFGTPIYIPSRLIKICDALDSRLPSLVLDVRDQECECLFSVLRDAKTNRIVELTIHVCNDRDEESGKDGGTRESREIKDGERFSLVR